MIPDVTGTWVRESDQLTMTLTLENGRLLKSEPFGNPAFTHTLEGRYDLGEQCYNVTIRRTNLGNQCVTEMYGKLYCPDKKVIKLAIGRTDGRCDLQEGFTETSDYKRVS